jgi:hypothetical protein
MVFVPGVDFGVGEWNPPNPFQDAHSISDENNGDFSYLVPFFPDDGY